MNDLINKSLNPSLGPADALLEAIEKMDMSLPPAIQKVISAVRAFIFARNLEKEVPTIKLFKMQMRSDPRGDLFPVDLSEVADWTPKRMYILMNSKKPRGGHIFLTEKKIFTVAEGTCTVRVHDGKTWTEIPMEAGDGVVLEGLLWKEITDISPGAIIPCFSSMDIGNTLMRGISDFEQFKDIAHKALYSGNSESN